MALFLRYKVFITKLIDIQEKIQQGKGGGYERWAKVYNIKKISQALLFLQEHDVRDYATLTERASAASSCYSDLTATIKNAEKRLNEIADLKKHIFNYSKTKEVYEQYRKSGYRKNSMRNTVRRSRFIKQPRRNLMKWEEKFLKSKN